MRRKNYFTVEVDPTEKVPNWKWKPGSQGQLPAGSLELETPLTPPSLLTAAGPLTATVRLQSVLDIYGDFSSSL